MFNVFLLNVLGKKILKMVCVGALDDMSTRARDFSLQELAKKHIDTNLKDFSSHDSLVPFEQQVRTLISILFFSITRLI